MPRVPRVRFPGAHYHVFNRGVEKRPIAFDDRDRKTFLQLLGEAVRELELRLFSYCLMDNHFHLFLQTPKPNLDQAMQSVQGQYALFVNRRHERVGALFQGRYKSRLVEVESYALPLARYIHRNPVEAGMAQRPEEYPWSSYPSYTEKLPKWSWLDTEWLLSQFHKEPTIAREVFKAFHQMKPAESERKALERWTRHLGDLKGSDPYQPRGV